jgi:hypothetical protein
MENWASAADFSTALDQCAAPCVEVFWKTVYVGA